jgi:hypothetical protein
MASSQSQTNELWPLLPVFFIGLWVFVSFTISRMGWNSFAERYPALTRPRGMAYRSPSTWFGSIFARYGNVVHVIFTDAGVYFYTSFLFRAFHPPFLVPWESVKRVEKKRVLFWSRYRIDIQDSSGEIHVILPVSVENVLLLHEMVA